MDDDGHDVVHADTIEDLRVISENLVKTAAALLAFQRQAIGDSRHNASDVQLALAGFEQLHPKGRPYKPHNPLHRVWRTWVLDMQDCERKLVGADPPLPAIKQNYVIVGGESVKTITRTMVLYFKMPADYWPPSLWDPDQPPADYEGP